MSDQQVAQEKNEHAMTPQRRAEISATVSQAYEEPWEEHEYVPARADFCPKCRFIAHARQDVPDLLAEVARLEALLAANHRAYLTVQGIDPDAERPPASLDRCVCGRVYAEHTQYHGFGGVFCPGKGTAAKFRWEASDARD